MRPPCNKNLGETISLRPFLLSATAVALALAGTIQPASVVAAPPAAGAVAPAGVAAASPQDATQTATPIKHLVVIFNENVSFDHYFATYPKATNPPGEPAFAAAPTRRPSITWRPRIC